MQAELVIERSTGELRAATLEEGRVVALAVERGDAPAEGAILLARVSGRGGPDGAVFLDLGRGSSGFLARPKSGVSEGESLLVELSGAPREAGKAWTVRHPPRLRGRYMTLDPAGRGLAPPAEAGLAARSGRLETFLQAVTARARVALRPAAAAVPDAAIAAEAQSLLADAESLSAEGPAPRTLRPAPAPLARVLREAPPAPAKIRIEEPALLAEARRLAAAWPDIETALALERGEEPLFEAVGAEDALESVIAGVLVLPSGGRITLEETRAAAVIDVDSGPAGEGGERVRLAVNREAAEAAADLIRLADVGGLILIDFLDLRRKAARAAVLAALDRALARDPLGVQRSGMNAHGVVSLARPRRRSSLRERLLERGGAAPTLATRALALLRGAEREARSGPPGGALVLELEDALAGWIETRGLLDTLKDRTGRPVRLQRRDPAAGRPAAVRIERR